MATIYDSPEIASMHNMHKYYEFVSEKSDIFSLGVILFKIHNPQMNELNTILSTS